MDEDAVLIAIGGLTEAVKNQGREICQLRTLIKDTDAKRDVGCKDCRDEIDTKEKEQDAAIGKLDSDVQVLKDQKTGKEAVSVFLNTTLGQVSLCVGILTGSAVLICVYVVPVVRSVFG